VKKVCRVCKEEYTPNQYITQLYCGRICKNRARYLRAIAEGKPRKGGYSRSVYIRTWMRARGESDFTAPCKFCGKKLKADEPFNLAHTVPRSELTFEQIKSEEFLTLSCPECNIAMGTMTEAEFTGEKQ